MTVVNITVWSMVFGNIGMHRTIRMAVLSLSNVMGFGTTLASIWWPRQCLPMEWVWHCTKVMQVHWLGGLVTISYSRRVFWGLECLICCVKILLICFIDHNIMLAVKCLCVIRDSLVCFCFITTTSISNCVCFFTFVYVFNLCMFIGHSWNFDDLCFLFYMCMNTYYYFISWYLLQFTCNNQITHERASGEIYLNGYRKVLISVCTNRYQQENCYFSNIDTSRHKLISLKCQQIYHLV